MTKNYLLFLAVFVVLIGFSQVALAETITLPNPLCLDPASPNCIEDLAGLLTAISTYILGIIGVVAALIIVIAGIMFVTSAGNPERTGKAKKMLLWAIIGIAIVLAAEGILTVIKAVLDV